MAQIPILAPANLPDVDDQEWDDYTAAVTTYIHDATDEIQILDPTVVVAVAPPTYTANPTTVVDRLVASIHTTAWMYATRAQVIAARAAVYAAPPVPPVAPAAPPLPPVAPPVPPVAPPAMGQAQIAQMLGMLQQQLTAA